MKAEALAAKLKPFGQQHLLAFWDQLDERQRNGLAAQIEAVDLRRIERLYREGGSPTDWTALAARADSPPAVRLHDRQDQSSVEQARQRGQEALRRGEVGALLVAGGQGTRLGFAPPKGMYPIGPVSEASLFQILLEKILATSRRYGRPVPLYLMTSPATHDDTVAYLNEHDRFGLAADEVTVFCQGTMPAVDAATGKLLLAEPGQLCLSPDGHGGALEALACSGALDEMRRRGLKSLFYFQVDNPLAPVCDPEFLGYHLAAGSELSTLVVAKQAPRDRVGNVVSIDDRVQIIEYSDLPPEAAERRNGDGSLALWAGNTAIHVFDVTFLAGMAEREDSLPFHVANKPVPHLDANGGMVAPGQPNALKFERFIFDLMPAGRNAMVVEVDPRIAFAPLKNASGDASDTPESVRAQIISLHRQWLQSAGARVDPGVAVEISPLFALDAEALADKIERHQHVTEPTNFD